ncbi:MAG: hypothetical protein Q7S08_04720 [bacterium]|nr:hypothetical protein [bacterium]
MADVFDFGKFKNKRVTEGPPSLKPPPDTFELNREYNRKDFRAACCEGIKIKSMFVALKTSGKSTQGRTTVGRISRAAQNDHFIPRQLAAR